METIIRQTLSASLYIQRQNVVNKQKMSIYRDTSNAPLRNLIFEVFLVHQFFDLYVDKVKKYCYYTRFLRTSEELTQIVLNHQEVHRKFMSLLFCLIFLCLFVCQKKNKQTNNNN